MSSIDTADEANSVRVTRRYPVPPAEVFRAITDPDELVAWFWPPRFAAEAAFDPRVGGAYTVRSIGLPDGQNMGVTGRVVEAGPPDRLVVTWRWDDEDDESTVTFTVVDVEGGAAELVVAHDGLASAEARANHIAGWTDCLDRLTVRLGGEAETRPNPRSDSRRRRPPTTRH
jgi:uncharacterized protein YndB with AHSA1/START domain